jgi:hypothetical protein
LVQYTGVEMTGAIDIPKNEIEAQIEGLLRESFLVDWAAFDNRLFIRVWDPSGPEPPWDLVQTESHLADVEGILKMAERAGDA